MYIFINKQKKQSKDGNVSVWHPLKINYLLKYEHNKENDIYWNKNA